MASAMMPSNYMIKVSDDFNGELFKGMQAGAGGGVSIASITHNTTDEHDLSGYFSFVLDAPYFTSNGTYLAVSATSNVTGANGEEVERRKHVITRAAPYDNLVHAPDVSTRWLEVKEDDYGWRSEPYLKKSTDEDSVRYEEFSPYGDFEHFREFFGMGLYQWYSA